MYAWIWARLPGPTGLRAVLMAALLLVAVVLLFAVFPLLRPPSAFRDGTDPVGPDPEQVVEPDGVRTSPRPVPSPPEPSPMVPEDNVPQQ